MREILFDYDVNPTTWVYISSLMTIGIFFKFRRFWSVRNLDLVLLIAYAPGLLMVARYKSDVEQLGYLWLFTVSGLFLLRLLLDPMMVRRPLLEPNLSAGGLTFTCIALMVFLMTNVVTQGMKESEVTGAIKADHVLTKGELPPGYDEAALSSPGYPLFHIFAGFSDRPVREKQTSPEQYRRALVRRAVTRTTAILAHLAVVVGLVVIGYRHYDNIHTGVAMGSLYALLPYTAQMTPRVDHVIPAALLVWTVEAYRRPVVSGIFLALATSVIFYPAFLLPLWCSFYWRRGLFRFLGSFAAVMLLMTLSLALTSNSLQAFGEQLRQMYGVADLAQLVGLVETPPDSVTGFWQFHVFFYRIPVFVAFVVLCASMALWPPHKNYATLLSCSGAVMVATQFWHVPGGGLYMNWYLPLLILTIFRPNLEDRVAMTAVVEGFNPLRRGFQRARRGG